MINDKKVLALVPARGGSKGIKHKNIYPLNGKPLLNYTLEAAKESKYIDKIIVSTDDNEIAAVSEKCGVAVPSLRPEKLSGDTVKSIDVALYELEKVKGEGYDILVFLQPTSPLRRSSDIDAALETFIANGERSTVSVSPVSDNPVLMRTIGRDGKMTKLLDASSTVRRQDMKEYYRVNGAIYVNSISEITPDTSLNDNEIPYVMSAEHSIDIDEMADIRVAEAFINKS